MPGSGKTHLTSLAVDTVRDKYRSDPLTAVVFFYCQVKTKVEPEELLGTLLQQLILAIQSVPAELQDLFDALASRSASLSMAEVLDTFVAVADSFTKVYVLVDALDELSIARRRVAYLAFDTFREGACKSDGGLQSRLQKYPVLSLCCPVLAPSSAEGSCSTNKMYQVFLHGRNQDCICPPGNATPRRIVIARTYSRHNRRLHWFAPCCTFWSDLSDRCPDQRGSKPELGRL